MACRWGICFGWRTRRYVPWFAQSSYLSLYRSVELITVINIATFTMLCVWFVVILWLYLLMYPYINLYIYIQYIQLYVYIHVPTTISVGKRWQNNASTHSRLVYQMLILTIFIFWYFNKAIEYGDRNSVCPHHQKWWFEPYKVSVHLV